MYASSIAFGSKVKQALSHAVGSHQHSRSPSHYTTKSKDISSTSTQISIPQLMCENESLKQQVSKLKVQNSILEEFKTTYLENNQKQITFNKNEQPSYLQKQNKDHYELKIKQNKEEIRHNKDKIKLLEGIVEEYREKLQKLEGTIELEKYYVKVKEQEILKLEQTVQSYSELVADQNQKIGQLLHRKVALHDSYEENKETDSDDEDEGYLYEEIQLYQVKLHDYSKVKDDNYRLRNQLAQLMLQHSTMMQKCWKNSLKVEHLWAIKELQFANINQCLNDLQLQQ